MILESKEKNLNSTGTEKLLVMDIKLLNFKPKFAFGAT
jgi:hypothetical protein